MIDYECVEGSWNYAPMEYFDLSIPTPDNEEVTIAQLGVNESKEMLSVWSCPSGDDTKHLDEKVMGRISQLTNKNGHLPTNLAWMLYRFKQWPGLRYGMGMLSTMMEVAKNLFNKANYNMMLPLGINSNIKTGWQTLPQAFGGIGLLSFPIEQMICWLNMIIQHFGVPSTLGLKFSASLEALQLELGCLGNPLCESYAELGHLATPCLDCYDFSIHLEYPSL